MEKRVGVLIRLSGLRPDMRPLWGRMSAHQMVCHLGDSMRMGLGERPTRLLFNRPVRLIARLVALHTPVRFPRGAPTLSALDQEKRGSQPGDFDEDVATFVALHERFMATSAALGPREHPLFGRLTAGEWLRWAEKHTDHHLRQFGL
jgi:hypothetical protein